MSQNTSKNFMKRAVKEARKNLKTEDGGPFGAVVVRNGKVIAAGRNLVLKTNDPTMHAEISAIRKACKKLKTFDLSDCEIYTTCEPCPMCMGAVFWAGLKCVYYGCTRKDAESIGFSDNSIYEAFEKNFEVDEPKIKNTDRESCIRLFEKWSEKERKMY